MADPDTVPCPLCSEPVPRGARRCDSCGADVAAAELQGLRAFMDPLEVDLETARLPRDSGFRDSEDSAGNATRAADGSTLYLCPSCGAFVNSKDARCARCGADLAEDGPTTEPRAQDAELDELAGLCPDCGSVAPTGLQTCAVCGASLRPAKKTERPPPPPPDDFGKPSRPADRPKAAPRAVNVTPPAAMPETKRTPQTAPVTMPRPEDRETFRAVRPAMAPESPANEPAPRPEARADRPSVPRGVRVEPRRESRLQAMRDVASTATLVALLATAAAASAGVPGREWGQLFAFGALFGIGITLLLREIAEIVRSRTLGLLLLASLAILVAVPLLGYGGVGSEAADGAVLAAGTALLALVVWRTRRTLGPTLAWTAGLLLLTILAISPFVFTPPGSPVVESALWVIGGGLALSAAGFLALRRWLRTATSKRLLRADAAYSRRDYTTAVKEYDAAIALARRGGLDLPGGWYGKGAALVAAGRLEEALAALDRALSMNPENEVAWINKGTALSRLGRMSDALKCYNSAIKVNPAYEVAWNNKGNALARLGKPDLALACYERALEIDTGYRTAWVNKGFVLAKLGRFEEAAECADAALRLTTGAAAGA